MSRKTHQTGPASGKATSRRTNVGSYPVLNPAVPSKVGRAKLARAVKRVWDEKTGATSDSRRTAASVSGRK